MSPTNSSPPSDRPKNLHIYSDYDTTITLNDSGDLILAHQMGAKELLRIDQLPETDPTNYTLRKAEDLKWTFVKISPLQAVDILLGPTSRTQNTRDRNGTMEGSNGNSNGSNGNGSNGNGSSRFEAPRPDDGLMDPNMIPFDVRPLYTWDETAENTEGEHQHQARRSAALTSASESYRLEIDPGFKELYLYCKERSIPITIISLNIQPLIEDALNRYLGEDHGIEVRANGLTTNEDGSWRVLWRDSSPFGVEKGRALREARKNDLEEPLNDHILWCGDGKSDFPAALEADVVLARENTPLEKLCRANQIPHKAFTNFSTVRESVEEWVREHRPDLIQGGQRGQDQDQQDSGETDSQEQE